MDIYYFPLKIKFEYAYNELKVGDHIRFEGEYSSCVKRYYHHAIVSEIGTSNDAIKIIHVYKHKGNEKIL